MHNGFDSFSKLPVELQKEALREGEARLQAQLQVATAADQRALTWGGLLVAAVTGALGGGVALISKAQPDNILGLVALGFALSMLRAAWLALDTVRPGLYCLPGNTPGSWLPQKWKCVGSDERKGTLARMEQAEQITRHIAENAERAGDKAGKMQRSFKWARWTILVSGLAVSAVLATRAAPVRPHMPVCFEWRCHVLTPSA